LEPVAVNRVLPPASTGNRNLAVLGLSLSGWRDLNSRPLDPQTSAACPRTSSDVQSCLEIRILHSGVLRWTNPNGGQNGGQTHSQTKRTGVINFAPLKAQRDVDDFRRWPVFAQEARLDHCARATRRALGSEVLGYCAGSAGSARSRPTTLLWSSKPTQVRLSPGISQQRTREANPCWPVT
jgi:hypothetical protein